MNDEQLLRYSRHILLNEVGVEGQHRILDAHVLIVGAGGLGAPAALYLGAAGVGCITLVDDDTVDLSNLQRQIQHTMHNVGLAKVDSAAQAVHGINPDVAVRAVPKRADANLLDDLVAQADVVLDCCDNYATRHLVNAACVEHGVPLVVGAAIRMDGQLTAFDVRREDSPCYACLFAPQGTVEEIFCATQGVLGPLVGVIGSMQAVEALKFMTGTGSALVGRLLLLNALQMRVSEMHLARNPDCPVCRVRPAAVVPAG